MKERLPPWKPKHGLPGSLRQSALPYGIARNTFTFDCEHHTRQKGEPRKTSEAPGINMQCQSLVFVSDLTTLQH